MSFQEARGRDALGTAGRMPALQDHSNPSAGNGDLLIGRRRRRLLLLLLLLQLLLQQLLLLQLAQ